MKMLKNSFREGHHPTEVHGGNDARQVADFYREFPKVSSNSSVLISSLVGQCIDLEQSLGEAARIARRQGAIEV